MDKQINETLVSGTIKVRETRVFCFCDVNSRSDPYGKKTVDTAFSVSAPTAAWQRKKCCYLKMRLDKNHYADTISDELLPNKIFETSALMVNQSSGYDIQYQYNKVHNLKLAGKANHKVLIRPEGNLFVLLALCASRQRRAL